MPRPRFEKLEPQRRAAILAAAAEEFAEHGFDAASYNRIIERSGLSKGAMYYYFDDKEDLFVATLQDAMQRVVIDAGGVEHARDAEEFWREVESWSRRSMHLYREDPTAHGLFRSLLKSAARGTGNSALNELRRIARGYVLEFVRHGQALGAIRVDLPKDALVHVLMGVEEGFDIWLSEHIDGFDAKQSESAAAAFADLYRRVAQPGPKLHEAPLTKEPRRRKDTR